MSSGRGRLVSCSDLGSPIDQSGAESTQIGEQGPPSSLIGAPPSAPSHLPPLVEVEALQQSSATASSAQPAARKSATRRIAGSFARVMTPRSRTSSSERRGSAQEEVLLPQVGPDAAIEAAQREAIEAARQEAFLAVQAEADALKAKLQAEAEAREEAREAERETERLRLQRANPQL